MQDWVLGYGYIKLREQIHRAEENFLLIAPRSAVLAEAWRDKLRLQDSTIPNHNALLDSLNDAVAVLNAPLQFRPGTPPPAAANPPPTAWTAADEFAARDVLREVRRAINEFRDERRTGIVRARNRLLRTVTLTGLVTFLLVALATLTGAKTHHLIAGATFFLVGAIVGLFNQLYLDARTEAATEDYGLATVRLLHTPLISGLAALGAVLIIPALSVVVNSSNPGEARHALAVPGLTEIFDLGVRPFGLVLAAIFGMSPVVLISRLQQEAERYKAELKSSEASSQRPAVPTTP
jgi:hypothetical protein